MKDFAASVPTPSSTAVAPIRLVVADDHPVVRFGVKNMLMHDPAFDVVGDADDGDSAITQALEHEPDILLLDLLMPRLPGLEAMGIRMLQNECEVVRRGDQSIYLAGIDDAPRAPPDDTV